MDEHTRREALYLAGGLGLMAAGGAAPAAAADDRAKDVGPEERERVRKVGMTEEEADCWVLAANLAGRFFAGHRGALPGPDLHPLGTCISGQRRRSIVFRFACGSQRRTRDGAREVV